MEDSDVENFARSRAALIEKDSLLRQKIREKKSQIYRTELQKRLSAVDVESSEDPGEPVHFKTEKV